MAGLKLFNLIKLSVNLPFQKVCCEMSSGRGEADGAGAAWNPGWLNHVRLRASINELDATYVLLEGKKKRISSVVAQEWKAVFN